MRLPLQWKSLLFWKLGQRFCLFNFIVYYFQFCMVGRTQLRYIVHVVHGHKLPDGDWICCQSSLYSFYGTWPIDRTLGETSCCFKEAKFFIVNAVLAFTKGSQNGLKEISGCSNWQNWRSFKRITLGKPCKKRPSDLKFWSRLFTIQWIGIREGICVIYWIQIYPVNTVIHLSNNWALIFWLLAMKSSARKPVIYLVSEE